MSLATIAAAFEAFAAEAVQDVKEEAVDFLIETAAAAEHSFEDLVSKLGSAATKLVAALMNDDSLSGLEKANLAATQLVEQAASEGIALLGHDATTLIKSGYVAVSDQINKLKGV